MLLMYPSRFKFIKLSFIAAKAITIIFSKLYFDTNSEIKILLPLFQIAACNHPNVFDFIILLSEGRAVEAWEPSMRESQ
jgi:hypothetical protein